MMLSLHVSLNVKYSKNPEKNEIMSVFFVSLLIRPTGIECGSDCTNKLFDHPWYF